MQSSYGIIVFEKQKHAEHFIVCKTEHRLAENKRL